MTRIQLRASTPGPRWALGLAALATVAVLSGCGGDPAAADPDIVPSLPTATSAEFTQFVSKRMADDGAEPLDVETVVPPTSESEEPIDLA